MKINKKSVIIVLIVLVVAGGIVGAFAINQKEGEIIPITRTELVDKMNSQETFYLYVGRPNCPDCQVFFPEFEKRVKEQNIKIFYFNSKVKASKREEMKEYVSSFGIEEIPAIVAVKDGAVRKVYDGQKHDDMEEFYEEYRKETKND